MQPHAPGEADCNHQFGTRIATTRGVGLQPRVSDCNQGRRTATKSVGLQPRASDCNQEYRQVMRALIGYTTRTSDIIVSESLEYLVAESLGRVGPFKTSGKSRKQLCVIDDTSIASQIGTFSDSEAQHKLDFDFVADFSIERSFLCAVPVLQDTKEVVQSTTEITTKHGRNPRTSMAGPPLPKIGNQPQDLTCLDSFLTWFRSRRRSTWTCFNCVFFTCPTFRFLALWRA